MSESKDQSGPAAARAEGCYARKLLGCRCGVIRWSHRSRFEFAARLVRPRAGGAVLDYGCGDGTFLAAVADRFDAAVGADIAADHLADNIARLGPHHPNLRFVHVDALAAPEHAGRYDVVTCMETLEHCPDRVQDRVLGDLRRAVRPGGRVIISVPIETGPTFLVKYAVRKVAGRRGHGDYRYYESYPLGHAVRMILATESTDVPRPLYGPPETAFHTHYGFNWRALRAKVRRFLHVERTHFTPLGFLGGWFDSQAWFVCRPRPADNARRDGP
jgi:SAM-dependent methyltransferase